MGLPNGTCVRMEATMAATTVVDPQESLLTLSSQKVIRIAAALISAGILITPPCEGSSSKHPVFW